MTQERIDLLDQLGFSWEVRPSLERPRATWQQRLEELQTYHQTYGNFLVDPLVMPQLHAWCHEQRNRLRQINKNNGKDLSKRMSPERAQALHDLGFTKDTILLDANAALTKVTGTSEEEIPPEVTDPETAADLKLSSAPSSPPPPPATHQTASVPQVNNPTTITEGAASTTAGVEFLPQVEQQFLQETKQETNSSIDAGSMQFHG